MKIACIQPKVMESRDKCYSEVNNIFRDLFSTHNQCDIACLPERWTPISGVISQNLQEERGDDYNFIKELAKEFQTNIISGAIWEKRKNSNKPFVTSYFINDKGEEIGRQKNLY